MKTIVKIAKVELEVLFCSSIAWVALTVFAFQVSMSFLDHLQFVVSQIKLHVSEAEITQVVFGGSSGVFANVREYLYFYVPLLTMGLISRETSSGSIKLLQSSPVSYTEIILGKFLGIAVFGLSFILILLLIALAACGVIVHADFAYLLSGILGVYLVICAYFAIGLMISGFTSYQVIAAISSFTVLAALQYIGGLWQSVPFLRDITNTLAISGRSTHFIQGIISSKDVIYYLLISACAIGISIFYFRFRQYRIPMTKRIAYYSLLGVVILSLGWMTSRPGHIYYLDMTASKMRTISPTSQGILQSVNGPLKINTYVNLMDPMSHYGLPKAKNEDLAFYEQYQRFLRRPLDINYVYYYDSCENTLDLRSSHRGLSDSAIVRGIAASTGVPFSDILSPAAIRSQLNLSEEKNTFVRSIEFNGKRSWLRMFRDPMTIPLENEVAASIKALLAGPVEVAVATNNQQRRFTNPAAQNYQQFSTQTYNRVALINQGFDIKEFDLDHSDIPATAKVLVIADPKTDISPVAEARIKSYIDAGGNLLIAGEPGRQVILNPLLQTLGVQLAEGKLLQGSHKLEPDLILGRIDRLTGSLSPGFMPLMEREYPIMMPGATAVLQADSIHLFQSHPLLLSDSSAWSRTGPTNTDSGYVSFDPAKGDKKGQYILAMGLTRIFGDRQQRIVILGDADCLSSGVLRKQNIADQNADWALSLFGWLSNDTYPIDTDTPPSRDTTLRITRNAMPRLRIIFQFGLPLLLLFSGGLLLLIRRRR
ncbi:MAG: Gldg family protein [Bacteroidota bacterium]|nr:Gldg family protein [Bacteroidota bacterium]MDP4252696.1 Gldg family protein [Bacteroidota bacterium]MDP4259308.1 Gldg family protein [Bacteroidota bacterium]